MSAEVLKTQVASAPSSAEASEVVKALSKDMPSTISASVVLGTAGVSVADMTAAAFAVCSTLATRTSATTSLERRLRRHLAASLTLWSRLPNALSKECEAAVHSCAFLCERAIYMR